MLTTFDADTYRWCAANVDKALPCPFCGERLIIHHDHFEARLAHEKDFGCMISDIEIGDDADLEQWNRRAGLTQDDAKKLAAVISLADGGCAFCVGNLAKAAETLFPQFSFTRDKGEWEVYIGSDGEIEYRTKAETDADYDRDEADDREFERCTRVHVELKAAPDSPAPTS